LIIRSEYTLDDYLIIKNIYEYFSSFDYFSQNKIEAFENKLSFDKNHQTKINDNLSNKYKNKSNSNKDNSSNKTIKILEDATKKIILNRKSKLTQEKKLPKSNLMNWIIRQCFIKGINMLNNSIKILCKNS
jgi:hypothetical protein